MDNELLIHENDNLSFGEDKDKSEELNVDTGSFNELNEIDAQKKDQYFDDRVACV